MSIPFQATHKADDGRYYMVDECEWFYANHMGHWKRHWSGAPAGLKAINQQKKQWSGPEDGLPPVGLEVEIKIDFKKAPPYAIITLTELGVDVQNHTPRFQKVKVLYASSKYLVAESCGAECLTPMSCVEIRAIRTPEQLASDKRETAIRELMDIAQVDCRVTAARLVDAGFKREVV